jgi:hypothetical protein
MDYQELIAKILRCSLSTGIDRRIERWMDIFSDDEPDLMTPELVREFDNLTKKFYSNFDDDLNDLRADLQLHMCDLWGSLMVIFRNTKSLLQQNNLPTFDQMI